MQKSHCYKGFMALLAGYAISTPVMSQSLSEAIAQTVRTNPDILTSTTERAAVEQEVRQSKGGYLPTVDVNLGWGYEEANNPSTRNAANPRNRGTVDMERTEAGVQARQMIFDGFGTPNDVRRTQAKLDAQSHQVYATAEKVALDAAEAYFNVLRQQDMVANAQENLALHEKTMDQIRIRSEGGVGRRSDASQAEGRVALARKNLLAEEANLRDAEYHFQRVIGALPDKVSRPDLPDKALPRSLDEAIESAVGSHPQLKSAESDINEADAQHDVAKAPFYPRVDAELSATAYSNLNGVNGYNNDYQAMLRMRYNLFRGGRDEANLKRTAHLKSEAKEIRNHTYRQVVESMRYSWNAYQTVGQQLQFFTEHLEATQVTYKAYQQQFNLGERTLLDLLDTANELFSARSEKIKAEYDHLFAKSRVLASMGALNSTLQVSLPEESRLNEPKLLF